MVETICHEIQQKRPYLTEEVTTIYFGGGTPSLLTEKELKGIMDTIKKNFEVFQNAEVSLEANPEDLDSEKLASIKRSGINRLSIGVQTFSESHLKWMNRAHSSMQAIEAYENARQTGFDNISLDLIYAIPEGDDEPWESDLRKLTDLQPEHISLYGLTIEDRTVFGKKKEKGELVEVPEDEAANQYLNSIEMLTQNGYEQYEVSNFCKSGFESKHNSSYWSGKPYLGIGPGAHSFNGESRQFNIRNNPKYIKLLETGQPYFERERLSLAQRMNETIMTRFRTIKGLDVQSFNSTFSLDLISLKNREIALLRRQHLLRDDDLFLSLTSHGILVADEVALQLFFDE